MRSYKRKFRESFLKGDIERAVQLTCNILGKRLGTKFYLSPIPDDVEKIGVGKVTGQCAYSADGRQIRFNTKFGATSGEIESIDIWFRIKQNPDLTIETQGISIVKIIHVIQDAFTNKKTDSYQLEERIVAKSQGKVSTDIAESINAWYTDMKVDEDKLAKTRMKHLYNQGYLYWYHNVREDEYKLVPEASFRNYMIQAFEKHGIRNIFMRTVTTHKAGKEKQITDERSSKKFDEVTYAFTLRDTIEFLKTNVRLVTRGYENAMVIAGTAGVGKTRLVEQTLKEDNVKYRSFSGGIKNPQALFNILSRNNDPNLVLVFDDADAILSKKYEDITKAILAPGRKGRKVMWYDAKYKDIDSKKYSPEIIFKSRVIIITNMPKKKISSAIISRTAPIEINVDIPDIVDDLRINLNNIMTEFPDITYAMKEEVLDFLEEYLGGVDVIDYRIFTRCVAIRASGVPDWKKMIKPFVKMKA